MGLVLLSHDLSLSIVYIAGDRPNKVDCEFPWFTPTVVETVRVKVMHYASKT